MLFVLALLRVLFFVAATSTLYVKLFTQVDEDRRQGASLRRLAVSRADLRVMLSRELAVLLLAPVVVASVHAAVAAGEFATEVAPPQLSPRGTWLGFAGVVVAFAAVSAGYFALARWRYTRRGLAARTILVGIAPAVAWAGGEAAWLNEASAPATCCAAGEAAGMTGASQGDRVTPLSQNPWTRVSTPGSTPAYKVRV